MPYRYILNKLISKILVIPDVVAVSLICTTIIPCHTTAKPQMLECWHLICMKSVIVVGDSCIIIVGDYFIKQINLQEIFFTQALCT